MSVISTITVEEQSKFFDKTIKCVDVSLETKSIVILFDNKMRFWRNDKLLWKNNAAANLVLFIDNGQKIMVKIWRTIYEMNANTGKVIVCYNPWESIPECNTISFALSKTGPIIFGHNSNKIECFNTKTKALVTLQGIRSIQPDSIVFADDSETKILVAFMDEILLVNIVLGHITKRFHLPYNYSRSSLAILPGQYFVYSCGHNLSIFNLDSCECENKRTSVYISHIVATDKYIITVGITGMVVWSYSVLFVDAKAAGKKK